MLGTLVNTLAIVAGSLIGLIFRGGIPEATTRTVMHAIGLAVLLIGIRSALAADALLLVIVSLAVGGALGEALRIEERLERLGRWLGRRVSRGDEGGIARGFVFTSLLYCVGAMAIVGSMESGLSGNHQTLFAKSILDGVGSILFASTLGVGVLFSAVSVFLYQGLITLSAAAVQPFLQPEVVAQMSAVGGLLIVGIGINLLELRRLKIGNMLPAVFVPLAWQALQALAGRLF